MKFLASLSGFVAFSILIFQIATIALVGWIVYFIYNNGLKALIDGIWMGFGI